MNTTDALAEAVRALLAVIDTKSEHTMSAAVSNADLAARSALAAFDSDSGRRQAETEVIEAAKVQSARHDRGDSADWAMHLLDCRLCQAVRRLRELEEASG